MLKDVTCVIIAFGAFITIGYSVYVTVTHADGMIFGAFMAGIGGLITLAGKELHMKYKYSKAAPKP